MQLGLATSQLNIIFAQQEVLKIGAGHFVLLLVSWELDDTLKAFTSGFAAHPMGTTSIRTSLSSHWTSRLESAQVPRASAFCSAMALEGEVHWQKNDWLM